MSDTNESPRLDEGAGSTVDDQLGTAFGGLDDPGEAAEPGETADPGVPAEAGLGGNGVRTDTLSGDGGDGGDSLAGEGEIPTDDVYTGEGELGGDVAGSVE